MNIKEKKSTTMCREAIRYQEYKQKRLRELQCWKEGKHIPYPDGFFGRCFRCGMALSEEIRRADKIYGLQHYLMDILIRESEGKESHIDRMEKDRVLSELEIYNQ